MSEPAYSGKTLSEKLGIKPGFKIYIENPPDNFYNLLAPFPEEIAFPEKIKTHTNMVIYFAPDEIKLFVKLKTFKNYIENNGMIWVCWLKKKPGKNMNLNENLIRDIALKLDLVDIKVCAVDNNWSALKLVIRKNKRI